MDDLGGPSKFASVISDDTGNVRKGRHLFAEENQSVFNLRDGIHAVHNTIEEVSGLEPFKEVSYIEIL